MAEQQYRLEMRGIKKSFPGVKALDGVNLKVRPGTVPRADGRKRRRKIDSDEMSVWHLQDG